MRPFLLLFLVAATPLLAAIDRTQKPASDPAPDSSFPEYTTTTLSNGLKVFVVEDDREPSVTFRLLIKSGSTFDPADKIGLSGFVGGLLNRGTKTRDAAKFAQESDFIGVKVEATAGADSISIGAGGLTKYTDKIIDLFTDALLNPIFPEDQLAKQKRLAISAIESEKKEPDALAKKLMGKVIFGDHPYGGRKTAESVQAVTRDDLVTFHKTHFVPNNASLAIVGDVKAAEIVPLLEKALAGWKRGEVPTQQLPKVPALSGLTIHLLELPGAVQSHIIVAQPEPARKDMDIPVVNVLNATLGGGFSGRLFQNLREKNAWTYGAYSAFGMSKDAGYFSAATATRNEVTALALKELLKEVARMGNEPVPEEELALQRQYNVGNYLLSLESASRTASRVQDIDLYDLAPDFYKTYAKRMSTVTAEQVQSLSKKLLSVENVAIIVVGEAKQLVPELEKIGKIVRYDVELQQAKE